MPQWHQYTIIWIFSSFLKHFEQKNFSLRCKKMIIFFLIVVCGSTDHAMFQCKLTPDQNARVLALLAWSLGVWRGRLSFTFRISTKNKADRRIVHQGELCQHFQTNILIQKLITHSVQFLQKRHPVKSHINLSVMRKLRGEDYSPGKNLLNLSSSEFSWSEFSENIVLCTEYSR